MKKIIIAIFISHIVFYVSKSFATQTNEILNPASYNIIEPFMNDKMREKLRPSGVAYLTNNNNIKTNRKVISRSATNSPSLNRKVVSRTSTTVAREALPTNTNIVRQTSTKRTSATVPQCLARYTDCMDEYCHRPKTQYDRCYCSPKLAQLDGEYKPQIDDLLKRITIAQNGGTIDNGMTQEEINELWDELFGASGENSMAELDAALDIDWAGTESTVRGQNAFVAGNNFCKQQLEDCFYMSENLKSMYRSTIGQDCKAYENHLQKLKYAAEQILNNYE